jgi:hypothetical protein
MSYQEYVLHYLQMPYFAVFLLIAIVLLLGIYCIFYVYAKKTTETVAAFSNEFFSLSERFYELVFSGGAIIGFMSVYWLIDRFVTSGDFYNFWSDYKDYLLLIFMIISIVLNTFWDHLIVRLKHLDRNDMASIRLTGMLYMILILCYLKFIYESTNYDKFIAYFITVMIGRFVYFDASFKDFLNCIKNAAKNIPIMIMALAFLSVMCEYGYSQEYLLKHNGVITNIFITHIVISVVIACFQWVPGLIIKKTIRRKKSL